MATKVLMPRIGSSVVEGTIKKWLVKEGDAVKRFQPLLEVSSEKATIETPSPADGVILKILFPAGARVPGYEIRLETPEGELAKPGEEGVMLVRGHSSAPCYWNRPDKTRETMRGDWLYTGDRFVERDGYYYFQGRADEKLEQ